MADLSDVSNALVTIATQAIYPTGTSAPSATGGGVKVFAGWPMPAQLESDLKSTPSVSQVSVWPRDEERNSTRYGWNWQPNPVNAATVTATIAGQTVTFAGTGAAGQNVAVLVNGQVFTYAVQAADTPTSIATALAALIVPSVAGTSSAGAVLSLPGTARIAAARVGVTATMTRELRRQERRFQVSVWAATPDMRDAIAVVLDAALSALSFLVLPDGSAARVRYVGSHQVDVQQKDRIYRRDLFYTVEYATTQTTPATQIVTEQINVTAQDSNKAQIGAAQINL